MAGTEKDFMSQRDLVEKTGIPGSTWEDWRYRNAGPPFYRLGRRLIRYRWADVEAWLETRREGQV